ncbi:uncharacterized protein LOC141668569 [Apium graveolens]|uniref:uncharacterized protein LOC141668028 n=1 Tax=Apium graveolens TaxID=4045 RepID=UPI003D79F3FE
MELTVLVQSSDGQVFEVEKKPILMSVSIAKELLSRPKSDHNSPIVLHQIDGKTLNKVIEYCKHHCVPYSTLEDEAVIDSLNAFDAQFVDVDPTTFCTLVRAARDLKIDKLQDLICRSLLKKIKGKNH